MRRSIALLKASILVLLINAALHLFPFGSVNRVLKRLGQYSKPDHTSADDIALNVWATAKAGAIFLGDKPCLTQALIMHWYLSRRDIPNRLQIGVRRTGDGNLEAHAWVVHHDQIIIGNLQALDEYHPLPQLDLFQE